MLQSGWRCWPVLCFAMFRECRDVSRRLRCGVVPESAESWRRRVPFFAGVLRLRRLRRLRCFDSSKFDGYAAFGCDVRSRRAVCMTMIACSIVGRSLQLPLRRHMAGCQAVSQAKMQNVRRRGASPFVLVMRGFCDFPHVVQFPVGQLPSVATGEDTTLDTSRGPILSSW